MLGLLARALAVGAAIAAAMLIALSLGSDDRLGPLEYCVAGGSGIFLALLVFFHPWFAARRGVTFEPPP